MIAFIRGTVFELRESSAVIDTGHLGYEVFIPVRDLSRLTTGKETFLYTWMLVREDAMALYGFASRDDLELFTLLLNVSGIGPKGALQILGALPANDLRFAVLTDDVRSICAAPGIGKKTAQKLILELKDKLRLEDAFEKKLEDTLGVEVTAESSDSKGMIMEAVEALTALGYSAAEANRAVRQVGSTDGLDVEGLLKAALKKL